MDFTEGLESYISFAKRQLRHFAAYHEIFGHANLNYNYRSKESKICRQSTYLKLMIPLVQKSPL